MALKLFSTKKEKLGFILFFLSVFLIPILIFATKQVNDIRQRAFESQSTPTTDPATLAFSFNTPLFGQGVPINQEFVVKLMVNSPLDVTAIESSIVFDQTMLEISSIIDITAANYSSPASTSAYVVNPYFENAQIVKKDYSNLPNGWSKYTILANPEESYPKANHSGYFAEIVFKAKKVGNTAIGYTTESAIAAKDFGNQNVLTNTYPIDISIIEKPQVLSVPITVKFKSLNSDLPANIEITANITTEGSTQQQLFKLQPNGPGQGKGSIILPVDKNYQLLLHRDGFLDVSREGYITSGQTFQAQTIDATDTPFLAGDIDPNGIVDIFDFNLLLEDFGKVIPMPCQTPTGGTTVCHIQAGHPTADLDFNGVIDIFDFNFFLENFGKGIQTEYITFTNKWMDVNTSSPMGDLSYFILFPDFTMPKNESGKITGQTGNNNPCQGAFTGNTVYDQGSITFTGNFTGTCFLGPGYRSGPSVAATGTFQGRYWTSIGYMKGTWQGSAETSMFGGQANGNFYIGDIQVY